MKHSGRGRQSDKIERQLESKLLAAVASPHHSQRIRRILKQNRTSAVGPELTADYNETAHRPLIAVRSPSLLSEFDQTRVAWAAAESSTLKNYQLPGRNRRGVPDVRDPSYGHTSMVQTRDLPTPRPALEPKFPNELRLPAKNSSIVQAPEVLRSPRRMLPKLPSLSLPVDEDSV